MRLRQTVEHSRVFVIFEKPTLIRVILSDERLKIECGEIPIGELKTVCEFFNEIKEALL